MRLWEVEAALGEIAAFDPTTAKVELEQYPTSPHLAAHVVHSAATSFDDVVDKCVVDLGCGTGMLSAACALLGARFVVGVDVDADALAIARRNLCDFDAIDLVQGDVETLPLAAKSFETCVMNPPFGTRHKGIDTEFIRRAIQLSTVAVYSLHKSSTRDYLLAHAGEWGARGGASVVAELRFDIPRVYSFHTRASADIAVDLVRFDLQGSSKSIARRGSGSRRRRQKRR